MRREILCTLLHRLASGYDVVFEEAVTVGVAAVRGVFSVLCLPRTWTFEIFPRHPALW